MSGLEVFGAVCGAFQTAQVAHSLWKQCREFYSDASPPITQVKQNAALADAAVQMMEDQMRKLNPQGIPPELEKVSKSLRKAIVELRKVVDEVLLKHKPGSVFGAMSTAMRFKLRKGKLESLKSDFAEAMSVLVSFMAAQQL